MAHERLHPSFHFDEERLAQLRQIAPEAFADGKVNWESLRAALGEHLEHDGPDDEHFGLSWPGKRAARRLAATPSAGALVPTPGEGLKADGNPDTDGHNDSRNVFIEGENLEVLKLLQKSYAGRIKMIYIDPPYNTGNDFVYEDDFKEPLQEYLRRTGQVDEEGRKLSTNTRADGRFHSKWLSMMYPRLRLARNLLRDDGVIFVSIDDNEVHHLRMLMNEVFGEENFIAQFIWKRRQNVDSRAKDGASVDHEYIICFRKSEKAQIRGAEKDLDKYSNPDNDPRGAWMSADMTGLATKDQRPNLHYNLEDPATGIVYQCPPTGWRYEPKRMKELVKNDEVIFPSKKDGRPRRKKFLKDLESDFTGFSTVLNTVFNTQGTRELVELFEGKKYFDFPKPTNLLIDLIKQGSYNNSDIVLDFFAGSGTLAQSVLEANKDDGIERRFICIQIPESIQEGTEAFKAGYKTIAEISQERIKRSIKKIIDFHTSHEKKQNKLQYLGFQKYSLTPSHYKAWQHYEGTDVQELESLFSQFESPLREGWTPEGLLTEVMLLEGFPLDSRQEALGGFSHNRVVRVASDFCAHALLVCLDARVHPETIAALDLGSNDVFICLDSAITDQEKLRLSDKGLIKTI